MKTAATLLAGLLAALSIPGCSGTPAPGDGSAVQDPRGGIPEASDTLLSAPVIPDRIDGFAGELVAIQIDRSRAPRGHVKVRLDDGVDLGARTYRLVVKPTPRTDPWMGPTGEWSALPETAGPGDSLLAVFRLPERAAGQGLWIGETRHQVQWLSAPEVIAEASLGTVWKPTLPPAAASNPGLIDRLREASHSPLSRWRVRLLLDGMRSTIPPTRFQDPIVEAWASYNEQRWRTAFARLALADAEVCERLRIRLSGVVEFGGGVFVPAWPTDGPGLNRLLIELLSPEGPGVGLAKRAEQFMAEQPQGVVWVVDDGGVLGGPDRRPLPLIGVANFTGRDALVFGYMGAEPARPNLLPAKAYTAQVLTVAGESDDPYATVRLSRWSARVPVAVGPVSVSPPGLPIGPLMPDLSMERWLYGQPAAAASQIAATALLHRPPPGEAGERTWELFVECRVPTDPSFSPGEDRVCICMGPPGLPGGVICVTGDGTLSARLLGADDTGPSPMIPVARSSDRWSFRLTLPETAIEPGDRLRLGIVRSTTRGRFSWPRPLLPWQEFPSRMLIDLSTWTGFE